MHLDRIDGQLPTVCIQEALEREEAGVRPQGTKETGKTIALLGQEELAIFGYSNLCLSLGIACA